ncbi:asparagine synthase (glutamine-hydrolyzing) [Bacillus thuringiensis]|uniref:asparagine synthase (glutamine-hydrolyzing) n=1 Tax=Bacillus thuringiensis TaxID=1428 RepID=UPI000BF58B2F|nr:asparagine synthase (glutamine-hydrolyzing) [Bacillus thuringiensis]PEW37834.1 asparagine synthase (glutamine-hydrolyzing) [Bacillus thuringiensis]PFK10529.1 asparagine synthase (glutamine-hydrolyzing) [Bacillus thuringiensis]
MCGIVGFLNLNGNDLNFEANASLKLALDQISYRGPDDEQILNEGPIGLGFKRLSILDISGGRQPLYNEDNSIVLVANGEIYNYQDLKRKLAQRHKFKTNSDCETIIHLYEEKGINFLEDLIGMYSIALWDKKKRKLILARDRLGIKPLFYSYNSERLIFASEIKSLFQFSDCPRVFDWENALNDTWLSGDISTNIGNPISYFKGIQHLPAGHYVEIDLESKSIQEKKYWDIPLNTNEAFNELSEVDFTNRYLEILEDSVHKNLQSDVEVGLFLSGGIDSAAIAAIAKSNMNLHTFSVLSSSTFINQDAMYAHMVSKQLGLENHQVLFDETLDDLLSNDFYKHLLWITETPFCGAEQLYKYNLHKYAKSIRPNLKVILTGQGSDEFNGGYSSMLAPSYDKSWSGFMGSIQFMERARLLKNSPINFKIWEEHFSLNPINENFIINSNSEIYNEPFYSYLKTKYRDLQMYNCWHEDRIAAANNIENRVPFLDHRLIELLQKIPYRMRSNLLWDKKILRNAMGKYFSSDICFREKVPFFYGEGLKHTQRIIMNLLLKDNYRLIEEAFSSNTASKIIDFDNINNIVQLIENDSELTNVEFLLRLVNMGLLEQMAIKQSNNPLKTRDIIKVKELKINDWLLEEEQISTQLGLDKSIDLNKIPRFTDGVLLVKNQGINNGGCLFYLIINGVIEFSINKDDNPLWLNFLLTIDGKQTLKEIFETLGIEGIEVMEEINQSIEFNILKLESPKIILNT